MITSPEEDKERFVLQNFGVADPPRFLPEIPESQVRAEVAWC